MTTNGSTSMRYCGGEITVCDGICRNCCKSIATYPLGGGTSNSNVSVVLVNSPYHYKIN